MQHDRFVVDALLRHDLTNFIAKTFGTVDGSQPYCHGLHIELIADRLYQLLDGRISRLIITLPPRSLKSICASVAFPAWVLGRDPTRRIICASYSSELAMKHARDCRAVMQSDWYRRTFPRTRINPKKAAEEEFETTQRGFRLATSVGGTLTGRGGNILIIDDPLKPQDALSTPRREGVNQWFDGTLYSRLDDKRDGAIVIIMQRVHVDDLVAHVLEKEDWVHLNLPAIAESQERHELSDGRVFSRAPGEALHPEREPLEVLEKTRATLGSFYFSAQYQQTPVPEGGNMVRWEWFWTYVDLPPLCSAGDQIVQSWDTAMKAHDGSDWSACSTWAIRGQKYYLLDVHRARLDFPSLKRTVIDLQAEYGANAVLIEDAGSGTGLIQQLRSEGHLHPIPVKPQGSKADRMAAQSALIEAGRVLIPESAPWLDAFRAEMLAFPFGKHDDQVDSISQFLTWKTRAPVIHVAG